MIDDTHDDDGLLYPLENEPDEYNRMRFALADATQQTTGYYAFDAKERDDGIMFTLYWYPTPNTLWETWHGVSNADIRVRTHDELVRYLIDSVFPLGNPENHTGSFTLPPLDA